MNSQGTLSDRCLATTTGGSLGRNTTGGSSGKRFPVNAHKRCPTVWKTFGAEWERNSAFNCCWNGERKIVHHRPRAKTPVAKIRSTGCRYFVWKRDAAWRGVAVCTTAVIYHVDTCHGLRKEWRRLKIGKDLAEICESITLYQWRWEIVDNLKYPT